MLMLELTRLKRALLFQLRCVVMWQNSGKSFKEGARSLEKVAKQNFVSVKWENLSIGRI